MTFLKSVVFIGIAVNSILLAASACADDASPATSTESKNAEMDGPFRYQLRSEETTRQDDRFPFGNWEVSRLYPEVLSESRPLVADAANEKIAAVVDRYRCDEMGDEAFKTQEVYLGSGILSMGYETMRMCSSMASPHNESGFLNLDLTDGSEIDLEAQFRTPEAYKRFQASAVQQLNRTLKARMAGQEESCPGVRAINGFHTDGEKLFVASLSREQGQTLCDVEAGFPLESLEDQLNPSSPIMADI